MHFLTDSKGLTISANDADRAWLQWWRSTLQHPEYFDTEDCLFRSLAGPMYDAGYEWISNAGALTATPIIGRRLFGSGVVEAFGYMDYQTRPMLRELMETGEVFLQRG